MRPAVNPAFVKARSTTGSNLFTAATSVLVAVSILSAACSPAHLKLLKEVKGDTKITITAGTVINLIKFHYKVIIDTIIIILVGTKKNK